MSSVAVVIATHNSAAHIGRCLDALHRHALQADASGPSMEIVVVDNASSDGTSEVVEERPFAKLVRNGANRGFAAAVNQGVRLSVGPLVLLLNPDAELETGLEDLVRAFDAPEVGAAGGKLLDSSGEWQRGFNVRSFPTPAALALEALLANRVWPGNPVNRRYRLLDFDPRREQDVDQPAGAFLMLRRETWAALGGFDESFHPVWFEDVDFCLRARRNGLRIRFVPGAVARHAGGHSVQAVSLQSRQLAWYGSFLRFCNKHFSGGTYRVLRAATVLGLCLRWIACWGAGKRDERKAYSNTLKMAMGSQASRDVSAGVGAAPIVES